MRHAHLALATSLLICAAGSHAKDWPRFLGPTGNSMAADMKINKFWDETPPEKRKLSRQQRSSALTVLTTPQIVVIAMMWTRARFGR